MKINVIFLQNRTHGTWASEPGLAHGAAQHSWQNIPFAKVWVNSTINSIPAQQWIDCAIIYSFHLKMEFSIGDRYGKKAFIYRITNNNTSTGLANPHNIANNGWITYKEYKLLAFMILHILWHNVWWNFIYTLIQY